jgi:hypothetical protein
MLGMNLLLWGITLGTIGKLILGIAVLRVHIRIFQEHSIDGVVLRAIKREHIVTVIGLILIAVGYILEVMFYNGYTEFFTCIGSECAGIIEASFRG